MTTRFYSGGSQDQSGSAIDSLSAQVLSGKGSRRFGARPFAMFETSSSADYRELSTNLFPSKSSNIAEVPQDSLFGSWKNLAPRCFKTSAV